MLWNLTSQQIFFYKILMLHWLQARYIHSKTSFLKKTNFSSVTVIVDFNDFFSTKKIFKILKNLAECVMPKEYHKEVK